MVREEGHGFALLRPLIAKAQVRPDRSISELRANLVAQPLLRGSDLIWTHADGRRLERGEGSTLEKVGGQKAQRILCGALAALELSNYLAPTIVIEILNGRQPVGLTARKLIADARLTLAWSEQRRVLGFA